MDSKPMPPDLNKSHEQNNQQLYVSSQTDPIISESTRSQRRGLSVSFADKTDVIVDETKQAITESMKALQSASKLGSIHEEYYGTPEDMGAESTALLKQYRERHRTKLGYARRNSYLEQSLGGASWVTGGFLLVSAALGAGILNYPVAYDRLGGIFTATVVQLGVLFILSTTMMILVYCSNINHDNSYHEVLYSICGSTVKNMAAVSILLSTFGICVTYYVIIGDQFDRIFATFYGSHFCYNWYLNRHFIIPVIGIGFIWPMCYFKNLEFLKHFNILGIIAMLYVVFLSVYEYAMLDKKPGDIKPVPDSAFAVLAAIPVVSLAYQTHELVVPVNACLKERTITNFSKSTGLALTLLFFLYCICGTFGYLTFGSTVSADIMQMYNAEDPIVVIGILALVVKMITTYPQIVLCGRDTFYRLLVPTQASLNLQNEANIPLPTKEFWHRISITTAWNVSALILAVLTPDITIAIGFLGAIGACNSFIFPGICMICLAKRQLKNSFNPQKVSMIALFIYGVFITTMGATMSTIVIIRAIYDLSTNSESIELCQL
ncbi:sodium-coupled neutral amino acid transporter 7-like [Oppia nitens]|uniref:sodium-coupled neutral amino acid transporter 7-like n=1 Tax=Oppia nitens TaxID=1686743 RepID=UPI0023DB4945|nr:sodium-coupled neutral amino acid transporter 7-like [Oppia nitens]